MTCIRCQHQLRNLADTASSVFSVTAAFPAVPIFTEPAPASPLGSMRTGEDAAIRAIQCLLEGCSIRSTERLTGLNRNTILRLLEVVGPRCARLLDSRIRNLHCRYIQCDEIWTFVQKKQRQVRGGANPYEIGDQWVFVAMDPKPNLLRRSRLANARWRP